MRRTLIGTTLAVVIAAGIASGPARSARAEDPPDRAARAAKWKGPNQ